MILLKQTSPGTSAAQNIHRTDHLGSSPSEPTLIYPRFSDLRSSIIIPNSEATERVMFAYSQYSSVDISAAADDCLECVASCQKSPCPAAEISPECTDQCVVIACTDPAHGEMSCHEGTEDAPCGPTCDVATDCTDCTGLEEFLQCCTDYHSYFAEPKIYSGDAINTLSAWNASLDALLCACTEGQQLANDQHEQLSSDMQWESSDVTGSSFTSLSPTPPLESASIQAPSVQSGPILTSTTYDADALPSELKCMWNNCYRSFSSLSSLVGHVNLEHLRFPASPSQFSESTQSTVPTLMMPSAQDEAISSMSCLWRDCTLFPTPESIPGPSSGMYPSSARDVLANHLLQDHLGLPSSYATGLLPSTIALPPRAHAGGLAPPSPVSASPTSTAPAPDAHQCAGPHVCHWRACGEAFVSCDDLTAHVTAAHIGAGKAQYECFWEGCTRHGESAFASKQKICRHLQSHTGHRPFQCTMCNQNFSEAATLQQHMRRHTQEKPYVCDFPGCGKAFAITGALTIHKRTHNGHKPFRCTYCDRMFSESSNLSKHLRTHTGARPYMCTDEGCGKAFARPDQLARHMGVHRKKEAATYASQKVKVAS